MRISKNTLLLGGAVTLGVLCFIGAQYYLRVYLTNAETRLAGNYKTRQVIVAAEEIPAGGVLSADNLATRTIPERYLASTALAPDSLDTVTGQKIMVAVKPGDPIDRGALERLDRAALSTTIAKGERAITFPVDEISSLSGMLVPGDLIDLMFTGPGTTANSYQVAKSASDAGSGPKELMHVRQILQAVTVMATGKTTQKRVVRTENGGQQEVNVDFSTVTLKVTANQAEQILLAQKLGQLTAVLRNPDDRLALASTVLDEATFKQVDGPPRAGVGSFIEMIIGGTGAAGGLKIRDEIGKAGVAASSAVATMRNAALGATAIPTTPPSALDVKNRLGLNASTSAASTGTSTPSKSLPR